MISPTIEESPRLFPQQCVCRSHGGPYMDLGVEVGDDTAAGFRGRRLYLCLACQHAVARKAGWVSPEDAAEVAGERDALRERVEALESDLEAMRHPRNRLMSVAELEHHGILAPMTTGRPPTYEPPKAA